MIELILRQPLNLTALGSNRGSSWIFVFVFALSCCCGFLTCNKTEAYFYRKLGLCEYPVLSTCKGKNISFIFKKTLWINQLNLITSMKLSKNDSLNSD